MRSGIAAFVIVVSSGFACSQVGYGPNVPPVVFITAFGDEELHEQAHHAGAVAVLDKPFDIDELRAFVNNFLAGRAD
jgi:DNA-binding response OmpR family regulator